MIEINNYCWKYVLCTYYSMCTEWFHVFYFHFAVQLRVSRSVQGLTVSDKSAYVLFNKSSDIEVYDAETLTYESRIPVQGLYDPCDIVYSENGLFVSDNEDRSIRRIELPAGTVTRWAASGTCLTLSVSQAGNIIVSSFDPPEISEYTLEGKQLRQLWINKSTNTKNCVHAIHVKEDLYLACSTKNSSNQSIHEIMKSKMGSFYNTETLSFPSYLAIDKDGFVLTVDKYKDQFVRLDVTNKAIVEIVLPQCTGVRHPFVICLQEEFDQLYVCEYGNSNNISVFDYNK